MWLAFVVCVVISAVVSLSFYYHWGRYGRHSLITAFMIALYTVGALGILSAMLLITLNI